MILKKKRLRIENNRNVITTAGYLTNIPEITNAVVLIVSFCFLVGLVSKHDSFGLRSRKTTKSAVRMIPKVRSSDNHLVEGVTRLSLENLQ